MDRKGAALAAERLKKTNATIDSMRSELRVLEQRDADLREMIHEFADNLDEYREYLENKINQFWPDDA